MDGRAQTEDGAAQLDLSVVIPAHNEAERIAETIRVTVQELAQLGCRFEVLVVDDGSKDDTRHLAAEAAADRSVVPSDVVRVISYERNGGKGYAVKYGAARTQGTFVAFLDADLELHPRMLGRFLAMQRTTGSDLVIGSKRHGESVIDYPVERKVYSTAYYYLCRWLFGLPVLDTQTGIKLIRGTFARGVLPFLPVQRFAFDLEMLAVAHHMGLRIQEAPVEMHFQRKFSRIRMRDIWGIFRDTLAIWWRLRSAEPGVAPIVVAGRTPAIDASMGED